MQKENDNLCGDTFLLYCFYCTSNPVANPSPTEGRASTGSLRSISFQNTCITLVHIRVCVWGVMYIFWNKINLSAQMVFLTSGWARHNSGYVPDLDPSGKTKLTSSWFSLHQHRFPNIGRPYLLSSHPTPYSLIWFSWVLMTESLPPLFLWFLS